MQPTSSDALATKYKTKIRNKTNLLYKAKFLYVSCENTAF